MLRQNEFTDLPEGVAIAKILAVLINRAVIAEWASVRERNPCLLLQYSFVVYL